MLSLPWKFIHVYKTGLLRSREQMEDSEHLYQQRSHEYLTQNTKRHKNVYYKTFAEKKN